MMKKDTHHHIFHCNHPKLVDSHDVSEIFTDGTIRHWNLIAIQILRSRKFVNSIYKYIRAVGKPFKLYKYSIQIQATDICWDVNV